MFGAPLDGVTIPGPSRAGAVQTLLGSPTARGERGIPVRRKFSR